MSFRARQAEVHVGAGLDGEDADRGRRVGRRQVALGERQAQGHDRHHGRRHTHAPRR